MAVQTKEKLEKISVPKDIKEKIQELAEKFEITPAEVLERIIEDKGFDDLAEKASKVSSLPKNDMRDLLLETMYAKMLKQLASSDSDIDLNKLLMFQTLGQQMMMNQLVMMQMIKDMGGNSKDNDVLQQYKETMQSLTQALLEKERMKSESSGRAIEQMYREFQSEIDSLRSEIYNYIKSSDPLERAKRAKEAMEMIKKWYSEVKGTIEGLPISEEEKRELEAKSEGDVISLLKQLEKVITEGRKLVEQVKGAGEYVPRPEESEEPEVIGQGGVIEIPEEEISEEEIPEEGEIEEIPKPVEEEENAGSS